ncbi:hypothetical protein GQ607_002376 [Colletotrichum asianum]|uniref:Uncharacterized protein n=1 Tax=Colletotrichum asianum TaxID=702518 RepID=A0A8H3WTF8_9PEZI|nr:hypothetical protein GQ607_002376 [Colletotrichum asianum]
MGRASPTMKIRLILSLVAVLALAAHLALGMFLQKAETLRNNGIFTVQQFNGTASRLLHSHSTGSLANFSLGFQEACFGYRDLTSQCFRMHDVPETVGSLVGSLDFAPLNEALGVIKGVNFDTMLISDLVFVSLMVVMYIVVLWVKQVLHLWGRVLLFIGMCIPLFIAVFMVAAIGMMKSRVESSGLQIEFGESAMYSGFSLGTAIVLNFLGAGLFT